MQEGVRGADTSNLCGIDVCVHHNFVSMLVVLSWHHGQATQHHIAGCYFVWLPAYLLAE